MCMSCVAGQGSEVLSGGRFEKRIADFDGAIKSTVFEIFAQEASQAEMLRICPEVGIEPTQLICRTAADGQANNCLCRVQDIVLIQHLLGFSPRIRRCEQTSLLTAGSSYRCNELDDGLIGNSDGVIGDASPETCTGNRLLLWKSRIVSINQYVGIDERQFGAHGSYKSSRVQPRVDLDALGCK